MKKIFYILSILLLFLNESRSNAIKGVPGDTVFIELGDNKKIAIVVNSREDLKALEEYDLNELISELNLHADSIVFGESDKNSKSQSIRPVTSVDEKKDTTYYFHRKKADINIELANYEIEIASNDFDDLGDDIEDFFEDYRGAVREETIEQFVPRHKKGFNIDLGMNNWLDGSGIANDDLYGVKPWGSWYIALKRMHRSAIGESGRGFINWGYGISWYNWKFENRNTRITKGENALVIAEDNTVSGLKSKLTASYLNFEMIPTIDFSYGKRRKKTITSGNVKITKYRKVGLRLGLGPYLGYRLGSKTKVVYKINGDKKKDKNHDNFYLNNLRYGIRAQVGFNRTDFFVNYDLNNVFNNGKGPKLNAISFGFII